MREPPDQQSLRTADFAYDLPPDLIAQEPAEPRDSSRLMVVRPGAPCRAHARFRDLPQCLEAGDVLVANRSKVIPARLKGRRAGGGDVELLLLRRRETAVWEALARPGRRLRPGSAVLLPDGVVVRVEDVLDGGARLIRFDSGHDGERLALASGAAPLPPYITNWRGDPERYQTVYADALGSAAAPTAGLHFTASLIEALVARGIEFHFVTLHVGVDTFRPVSVERPAEHTMHGEFFDVPAATAEALGRAKGQGRRIVAVGTTTVRTLEAAAEVLLSHQGDSEAKVADISGWTQLFILPGYRFRLVDGLITNFHLPRSTLLMLVSALAGRERVLAAYETAIRARYRFYSFGDAMLLWRAGA